MYSILNMVRFFLRSVYVTVPKLNFLYINPVGLVMNNINILFHCAITIERPRRSSSAGCTSAWYADGPGFEPHVRQYSFVEIGPEIIYTAILSLLLIQEGQLSVMGLHRNSVDRLADRARNDLKSLKGP